MRDHVRKRLHWLLAGRCRAETPVNVGYRAGSLSLTWRLGTRWLLPVFRLLGLVALAWAATGPFDWQGSQLVDSEGVAIELVIDRSGSMRADDYLLNGRRVSRLEAVREAAGRFIVGDAETPGRSADSIGLVAFAAQPEVACPLTIDHEAVVAELERTGAAADYREDGTAIGDAWALAIAELRSLEQSLQTKPTGHGLTKVAVLLTDGQQNAGRLAPSQAAELARRYNVRTYLIALEPRHVSGEAARRRVEDERERLGKLSAATGGRLFTVSDTRSLRKVYAEIDALERTTVGKQRLLGRRHWAVDQFQLGPFLVPPLALIALAALALECVLASTIFLEVT